jgi:hypothetical protein
MNLGSGLYPLRSECPHIEVKRGINTQDGKWISRNDMRLRIARRRILGWHTAHVALKDQFLTQGGQSIDLGIETAAMLKQFISPCLGRRSED